MKKHITTVRFDSSLITKKIQDEVNKLFELNVFISFEGIPEHLIKLLSDMLINEFSNIIICNRVTAVNADGILEVVNFLDIDISTKFTTAALRAVEIYIAHNNPHVAGVVEL